MRRSDFAALVLIGSAAAVLAYGYFLRVDWPGFEARLQLHNEIIAGTAHSPYRYRVLVPFAVEAIIQAVSTVCVSRVAFLLSYLIYDLLAITFLLTSLYFWFKTWFSLEQALVGVLFVAATMPIALQNHSLQPWSLLEAGLFTAALLAMQRRRLLLLGVIVALASLNRETAVFIPIAFLLTGEPSQKPSRRQPLDAHRLVVAGVLLLIWGALFWGLRAVRGSSPPLETPSDLLALNLTRGYLANTLVNGGLFLGGLWFFALLGFSRAPAHVRRVARIVPFYLAAILIWGVWHEVRLLMPLYPVFVPLGMAWVFPSPGLAPSHPAS